MGRGAATADTAGGTDGAPLAGVRDLAFHPRPGTHIGARAEGRRFPTDGEELWVADGKRHAVTVLAGVDKDKGEIGAAGGPAAGEDKKVSFTPR